MEQKEVGCCCLIQYRSTAWYLRPRESQERKRGCGGSEIFVVVVVRRLLLLCTVCRPKKNADRWNRKGIDDYCCLIQYKAVVWKRIPKESQERKRGYYGSNEISSLSDSDADADFRCRCCYLFCCSCCVQFVVQHNMLIGGTDR